MTSLDIPTKTVSPRRRTGRRAARRAAAAIAAMAAFCALTQPAVAGPVPPAVPDKLQVGAGHKLYLVGHAVGVQIYSCNPVAGGYAWALVAPRASLYNDHGKLLATHYGGPTWQAKDGSTAVGSAVERVTVDPTAIPWLKLSATGSSGPDGDRLVGTTFIQRIATTGGLAPAAASCTFATAASRVEIPYTADYTFWKAQGA